MGIEPTRSLFPDPSPVLKTGPGTSRGRTPRCYLNSQKSSRGAGQAYWPDVFPPSQYVRLESLTYVNTPAVALRLPFYLTGIRRRRESPIASRLSGFIDGEFQVDAESRCDQLVGSPAFHYRPVAP
jgi:hypothetical protein